MFWIQNNFIWGLALQALPFLFFFHSHMVGDGAEIPHSLCSGCFISNIHAIVEYTNSVYWVWLLMMDLIFFLSAWMVLCFEFVIKTMLIAHQCFGYCWAVFAQHQDFLFLPHSAPKVSRLEVGKKLGEETAGTMDCSCPKGYSRPCNMFSNKPERRELCGR